MTGEELFPKFIGRYEILRPLGTGAYGHAYLVRSPSGDEYAAKWLRSDPAEGGALRFKNEVWALQSLNHRCIPKLIEHGQVQDRPYIVMTFARGETLRTVHRRQMAEQAPISQLRMLTIAEDLLDALQHMHGKEICHRDVKDDNVIVTGSTAEVMLIDVGVCKGLGQPVDALTFWHAGASRFSPPSKLQFPSEACPAHDVFAIGVLGYALLTNQYPWSVGASEDRGHLVDTGFRARQLGPAEDCVARRLSEGAKIKVMLVDPRSEIVPRLAREEGQTPKRMLSDVAVSLGVCIRLHNLLAARSLPASASLDIRVFDEIPYFAYQRVAELVIIGFYFSSTVGHQSAAYEIVDPQTKEFFAEHFRSIFGRASDTYVLRIDPHSARIELNESLIDELRTALAQLLGQAETERLIKSGGSRPDAG